MKAIAFENIPCPCCFADRPGPHSPQCHRGELTDRQARALTILAAIQSCNGYHEGDGDLWLGPWISQLTDLIVGMRHDNKGPVKRGGFSLTR